MSEIARFVVDTNFFLQCRPADQLDWGMVTKAAEVVLMVPRAVQSEIDRLKQDGSLRRASKARAAAGLFRVALFSDPTGHTLREEAKPVVRLCLLATQAPKDQLPSTLDLDRPDDRIVGDALHLRLPVLSGDSGLLASARFHEVPFVPVPEGWALAPEPDRQSKELSDLRRRVDLLEKIGPALEVGFYPKGAQEGVPRLQEIRVRATSYEVDDRQIDDAVRALERRWPRAERFERDAAASIQFAALLGTWHAPSAAEIDKYTVAYTAWLEEARSALRGAVDGEELASRRGVFDVVLTNHGSRSAENIVLDVEATAPLLLDTAPDILDARRTLPPPPKAPTGKWDSPFAFLDTMNAFAQRPWGPPSAFGLSAGDLGRDRHEFYWSPQRPVGLAGKWRMTCAEFRHRLEPERFDVRVVVPSDLDTVSAGRSAVRVRVSAGNLTDPVTAVLPVIIEDAREPATTILESLVRGWPAPGAND